MDFLKKHAMWSADFSGIQRKDVWSIPLLILREAVINALAHADYSLQGIPIRIACFDDWIEIENPGILAPGMTIDAMKRGVYKLRNRVIARIFRELNLIEQWGSGVSRIFREAEIRKLVDQDIIEMTLPDKPNSHLQKYRISAQGHSFITELLRTWANTPNTAHHPIFGA